MVVLVLNTAVALIPETDNEAIALSWAEKLQARPFYSYAPPVRFGEFWECAALEATC